MAIIVAGIVLGIAGSSSLQIAGFVVAALALAVIAAGQLSFRDGPIGLTHRYMPLAQASDPAPDYIAEAGVPPDEAWEREEERYHERLSQAAEEPRPDA
jgi:hypothetical protein